MNRLRILRVIVAGFLTAVQVVVAAAAVSAQSIATSDETKFWGGGSALVATTTVRKYADPQTGLSADQAVAYGLEHNGELLAARKAIEAASALIKQAKLRANPKVDASVSKTITGADNNITLNGMLPLELGGRRTARIMVAEREFEMRRQDVANRERILASAVRVQFGEALAAIIKLGLNEDLIATSQRSFNLVAARVIAGGTAPLEQNMVLVELNRLRSERETAEGKAQIAMLELRNLIGMSPEEPLHLRGDLNDVIASLPSLATATEVALSERPDLKLAKAAEGLADARIEQARAEGRLDASLIAGYQRMDSSYPLNGFNDAGQLNPIRGTFHYFTAGISLDLPVRNKNQGGIAAALAEAEGAKRQREFLELTVRREVAAAYALYNSTARAAEIFRVGVKDQANANLDVVRQTYELGSKTLIDFLGEQRRFIELQNGYIDAVLETYKARVDVERAVGAQLPTRQQVTQR